MLQELMRRAGSEDEQFFVKRTEQEQRDPTLRPGKHGERRMSVISANSLWLNDKLFYYRVMVMVNCATACMGAAAQVACLGSEGKAICHD